MPTLPLKQFDQQQFLSDYWQKKPLLIRGGLANWKNPITANELAGLALEEEVESRLVLASPANPIKNQWTLEHGPFTEHRLTKLAEKNWTLLVQAVDHHVADVAQLLEYFRFIPSWQIDDVMVSFATRGGGVGPHFDRYDVFLVQGQGQREWQVGQHCNQHTPLQDQQAISLLAEFTVADIYTLSAGDILYLPPYIAHWGTALDNDCMTYSVGFRSPSKAELLDDYSSFARQKLSEDDRFRDAAIAESGAINAETIDNIALMLSENFSNKMQLSQWFGRWASQPKYPNCNSNNEETFSATDKNLDKDETLNIIDTIDFADPKFTIYRDSASRFYYMEINQKENSPLLLFVNGREIELSSVSVALQESVKTICNQSFFSAQKLQPWLASDREKKLLAELFENGELYSELDL